MKSNPPIDDAKPTAFVDESLRPGPSGLYVVAAVVVIDDVVKARITAERTPPPGKRFHWKAERPPYREAMLDGLVRLGCGLWTYECRCVTTKHERARAKSINHLLWDLNKLGVNQLVVESRGRAADRKDRRTILGSIKSCVSTAELVYEHRLATDDPGLWLADALASATAASLTGPVNYLTRLSDAVERKTIDL